MSDEKIKRACHAIGMDNRQSFEKYGKKHFISYRSYYVANRLGDIYFDQLEKDGLAESDRDSKAVIYYLTEKGFQWLEKESNIVIHRKNHPENEYPLNQDNMEQIKEIWRWLRKKYIFTSNFTEELDVAIWMDSEDLKMFYEYFGSDETPLPARIYQGSVLVLFSDLLGFKVSGKQIWDFRPDGMREEW